MALQLLDASAARPLRWCSEAKRRARQASLESALAEWGTGWGLIELRVALCNAWESDVAVTSSSWQLLAVSAEGQPVLWSSIADEAEVSMALFRTAGPSEQSVASGPELASALAADALNDLRANLAAALGAVATAAAAPAAPPQADMRPWSGAMRAQLTIGSGARAATIHVHASALAWPSTVGWSSPAPAGLLVPLATSVAHRPVALKALMSDLNLRLADLVSLRVGDVVVTQHALAVPLLVVQAAYLDQPLYAGHLAQRGHRVAISLLPATAFTQLPASTMSTSPHTPSDSTAQWLALPEANDPGASAPRLGAARNPLLEVKARLQVCVGEAVMTVGELSQAQQGQVVVLDREVDGLVDLTLEGRVVARGQLVAVGERFGIRLTELPLPLTA